MSCQQVPTTPAFNPYPRSVQVGEFEVAIGGGIWVAIRARNNNQSPIGVKEFKDVMVKKGYQAKRRNSGNVFVGLVINE